MKRNFEEIRESSERKSLDGVFSPTEYYLTFVDSLGQLGFSTTRTGG
jgi:hypothetical protein